MLQNYQELYLAIKPNLNSFLQFLVVLHCLILVPIMNSITLVQLHNRVRLRNGYSQPYAHVTTPQGSDQIIKAISYSLVEGNWTIVVIMSIMSL